MNQFSFADLFSGCGGLSLGLAMAGLSGRFAVERDAMAFETFAANFLGNHCPAGAFEWPAWLERKAWAIDDLLECHKADLKRLRGSVDVLAGGPPCQGFSFAGRRQEDDPRNLLFEKYVEVVKAIRPKLLVLENVPGMKVLHHRGKVIDLLQGHEEPRRQSFYERLVASLEAAGYAMEGQLVDAVGFGVPQRRSRLIAMGIRKDLVRLVDGGPSRAFALLQQAGMEQLRELGLKGPVSAKQAISDLEISTSSLIDCDDPASRGGFHEVAYGGPRTRYQRLMHVDCLAKMDSMRLARHRDDVRQRFEHIISQCRKGVRMDDATRSSYGLKKHRIFPMSATDPAPTVTTLPDDILHYSEPRILTVRESARLQSFPDWFEFKGKYTTGGDRRTKECPRYTQVGNAVPPLMARAIGKALHALLGEIAAATASSAGAHAHVSIAATA